MITPNMSRKHPSLTRTDQGLPDAPPRPLRLSNPFSSPTSVTWGQSMDSIWRARACSFGVEMVSRSGQMGCIPNDHWGWYTHICPYIMYVDIHIYTYIYIYICICIHIDLCMYIYIYIHTHTHSPLSHPQDSIRPLPFTPPQRKHKNRGERNV